MYEIEPRVTPGLKVALVAAGVDLDATNALHSDAVHGPTFRQRIRSKALTFCRLATRRLVREPTPFFVSTVRKNWIVSSSYEPEKKQAVRSKATVVLLGLPRRKWSCWSR